MHEEHKRYPILLDSEVLVCGEVTHGKRLGRTLGFPTANLPVCAEVSPRHGIYASIAEIDGMEYYAVSNVGTRPTVDGDHVNCETHIFDFSGDLYGRYVRVRLIALLRDEMRFSSVEELQRAIRGDVTDALSFFGKNT